MSNREEIIERSVRDYENKANSLYTKGYNEGHKDGCTYARAMGMADAWEIIKSAMEMPVKDFERVFDGAECLEDIRYVEMSEIAKRMKDYLDEEVRFEPGDVVIDPNGLKAIITNNGTAYHLYYPHNGKTWKAPKSTRLVKTGEHHEFLPYEL